MFDISTLYENQYEDDELTKAFKRTLRDDLVKPLRETGSCEKSVMDKLKEIMTPYTENLGSLNSGELRVSKF